MGELFNFAGIGYFSKADQDFHDFGCTRRPDRVGAAQILRRIPQWINP